jgi:hypothetical protein
MASTPQGGPCVLVGGLELHLRRFDETYYYLHREVVRPEEDLDSKTILSCVKGMEVLRSVESFGILKRIECRYRLPRVTSRPSFALIESLRRGNKGASRAPVRPHHSECQDNPPGQ